MDVVLGRARERARRQRSAAFGVAVVVMAIVAVVVPRSAADRSPITPVPTATPTASPEPVDPSTDPFTQVELGGFETIDKPRPGQVLASYLDSSASGEFPPSRVFVIGHVDGTVTVADAETRTRVSARDHAIVSTQVGWCPSTRTLQDLLSGEQWREDGVSFRGGSIGTHFVRDSPGSPGRLDVTRGSSEGGTDQAPPPAPPPCRRDALLLHDNDRYPLASVETASRSAEARRVAGYVDIALDRVMLCAALTGGRCASGVRVDSDTIFAYDTVGAYVLHGTFLVHRSFDAERGPRVVRLPDVRLHSRVDVGARHSVGFVHGVTLRSDGSADLSFDSTRYYDGTVAEEGASGSAEPVPAVYNGLVTNARGGLVDYRTAPGAPVHSADGSSDTLRSLRDRVQGRPAGDHRKLYWLVLDASNVVIRVVEQVGN